jgi:hypothetical protein
MTEETRVLRVFESFVLGKCRCGCNGDIPIRNRRRLLKRFVNLHNYRGENNPSHVNPKVREGSPKWNGGVKWSNGYLNIYRPDHPFCHTDGYVRLHRIIYEYFYKCCLMPWIDIHHMNGIRTDNHKGNLVPVTDAQHTTIHNLKDFSDRCCLICESTKTYIRKRNSSPLWLRYNDGWICKWCYDKQRYL